MSDERTQSPRRFRKRYIAFALIAVVVIWLGLGMYDALTMKPGTQVDRGQLVFDRALARAGVEASEYRESDNGWDALAKAIEIARESEQSGRRAVRARHPSSDFEYAILQVATWPLKTCSILAQSEASSCSLTSRRPSDAGGKGRDDPPPSTLTSRSQSDSDAGGCLPLQPSPLETI